jgi:hypothetical protein
MRQPNQGDPARAERDRPEVYLRWTYQVLARNEGTAQRRCVPSEVFPKSVSTDTFVQ